MLSTQHRRGFLWRIYDLTTTLTGSATTYATLLAAVQAVSSSQFSFSSTGTITAVSANGHSVSFGHSSSGSSPESYAENAAGLRDLYETSKANLISAGDPTPTDAEIFDEMMDTLQSVRSLQLTSMQTLRC